MWHNYHKQILGQQNFSIYLPMHPITYQLLLTAQKQVQMYCGSGTVVGIVSRQVTYAQGAYKFGKMKFPEFSRFSRPFE